ncbi:uncharacterized protein TNCV_156111 [Trichonephila clavipes]|nr:uncharacterized protein TNCV_156111 [Trichonephila clavipes]
MIVSKLKGDGLDIMNRREQAYDNAATMAGCHTGVQQRIKDINPNAKFVPCSDHSIHLVYVHVPAVEIILQAKRKEFVNDALIYAKSLCEELEISFPQDESGGSIHLATENLAEKYAFLRSEVILSMDGFNLDKAHQDINKEEFQDELVRLQAFVDATDSGCKKELIRPGSLS